jgi:hypothetical protein
VTPSAEDRAYYAALAASPAVAAYRAFYALIRLEPDQRARLAMISAAADEEAMACAEGRR